MRIPLLAAIPLLAVLLCTDASAQRGGRGRQVLQDHEVMKDSDLWIYNDLDEGLEEAKKTGKPLLITFR